MVDTWKDFKHFLSVLLLILLSSNIFGENHSDESEAIHREKDNTHVNRSANYEQESNEVLVRKKRIVITMAEGYFDSCSPYPCKNKGVCRKTRYTKKYFCSCPREFTGMKCEKPMPACKFLKCAKIGDCIGNRKQKSVLCICENGGDGELCDLKGEGYIPVKEEKEKEKESDLEVIEEILTDETKHNLVLVFAIVASSFALVFVCLCLHCCRANAKKVKLREKYKEQLQDGLVPKDVPPDLLDISNALFMSMFCCGSKSKLLKEDDDTERGSKSKKKSKDKNLNKTANSLIGQYRQPSSRSQTRRRTSGFYLDNRTKQKYPEYIDSYGSYEAMPDFNVNNPTKHAKEKDRGLGKFASRPRVTNNDDIHDVTRNKAAVQSALCSSSERRSQLPRKSITRKPITSSENPKSSFVSRYFGPSKYVCLKRSPRLAGKFTRYGANFESLSSESDQFTSDSDADSSSSEEELYRRDSDCYLQSFRKVNKNVNSNGKAGNYLPEAANDVCSRLNRRKLTSVQSRNDVNRFFKQHDGNTPELPSQNRDLDNSISLARLGTLSPDANQNFCTNNSQTMEDNPLQLNDLHSADILDNFKDNRMLKQYSLPKAKHEYKTSYYDLYRDQHRLLRSISKENEDIVQPKLGNKAADKTQPKINQYDLQQSKDLLNSPIKFDQFDRHPDESLDSWCMRVELVDEGGSENCSRSNATMPDVNEDVRDKLNRDDTTQIKRNSSADESDIKDSSDLIGTDKADCRAQVPDGHYIKCFEKDRSTLSYMSEEPLKGDQNVMDDFEVIPDGKGSVMVISKTEPTGKEFVMEVDETNDRKKCMVRQIDNLNG